MSEEAGARLRSELLAALAANTERLRDGLRAELARTGEAEADLPLQFEVDLLYWVITSCASEDPVIADDWLDRALSDDWFDRAEKADVGPEGLITEELCPWFADAWQAVGGPARFSPAYLFLHGYHDEQYDLERRCWVPATVAFGK